VHAGDEDFPTPVKQAGQTSVAICRLRLLAGAERSPWLSYWTVADNLKKGAATNAVQIFTELCTPVKASVP
jgi:aspartate-semialdehyde dehydrogenase